MAIGAVLRQARERRGLTVVAVASASRIPVHYIDALETEAFDDIPAPVYVRGFLRVYSRLLEIDPAPLLDELVAIWPAAATSSAPLTAPSLSPAAEPEVWQVPDFTRPPSPLPHRRVISDIEDDWEPELEPVVRTRGSRRSAHQKPGHLEGVLSEREPAEPVRLPDRRWIVLGGVGVIFVTVLLLGAAILRGAGVTGNPAGPSPVANRTFQPGTVITVGSPTATVPPSATPPADASVAAPGAPAPPAGATATPSVPSTPRTSATP